MLKCRSLFLCFVVVSCGNFVSREEIGTNTISKVSAKEAPVEEINLNKLEAEISDIQEDSISSQLSSSSNSKRISSTHDLIHDLDLDYKQKHYDFWLKYFSKKEQERFIRHAKNGALYRSVITKILESHNLPKDLFFVGLIESGYNTYIKSSASAVGPWQFIKGTATRYGLRVDSTVDERANIVKSTEAAASYFKDLYNIFGSWELALCAYNAGEYRIINAIRKGNTRDYKELVRKKLIPKETIFYIPKVAAARALYEDPAKYGLTLPKDHESPFEKVETIKITKSFDIYSMAKQLNVSSNIFKALNPELKIRNIRVTRRNPMEVFVPGRTYTDFKTLNESRLMKVVTSRSTSNKKVYKVKRGDNLISISKRLGVDIKTIKDINGISGSRIFIGQKLTVHRNVAASSSSKSDIVKYRVRRGDNLSLIARKYSLTLTELKAINNLRSNRIRIGQVLVVKSSQISKYKVRSGDNLTVISKKFGTSIREIKKANELNSNIVYSGQVLDIPQDEG